MVRSASSEDRVRRDWMERSAGDPPTIVNLKEKFDRIREFWRPKIAAELNESHVKLVKLKGEFVWHHHDREDELFLVVDGDLRIELRAGALRLRAGELAVIPRGMEHRPVAKDEVHVLLLEPKTTVNTGEVRSDRTVDPEWI
jgi:mannose-6-phosphate isomerase-like protein (cupin superfamily)